MGKGKDKSAQKVRTKGNVKPSNSDRASEFLRRNLTSGVGSESLVTFLTSDSASLTSSTSSPQNAFSSLLPLDQDPLAATMDSDFLNVLRRLEKRSAATKQKALDNLISLLREENGEENYVKSKDVISASVLPFWPRLFNKLACDEDRRVRELSQVAMHAIAKRLGRKLSPCLKEIIVTWTFATVDFYDSISKAALVGLSDTFPGDKRGELHRRFARYLLDECDRRVTYLISELPTHLKTKKSRKPDDLLPPDAHHQLNIAAQFLSWVASFLPDLCKLPKENDQFVRFRSVLQRILSAISPVLDKVKFAPLNSAYFRLIPIMCENMTEWIIGCPELLDFVLSMCLKENVVSSERLVSLSTLLSLFSKEIWTRISWKELVSGTLVPMVEQAQSRAQRMAVYTNLLPLVSHLPLETLSYEDAILMERLLIASREGVLRSLNIPTDADLRQSEAISNLQDQGSSVECLTGLFELSRSLLDRAALSSNQHLSEFLCDRIFLDFISFVFTYSDDLSPGVRRWIYRETFTVCCFKQVCATLIHLVHDSRSQMQGTFGILKESITELMNFAFLKSPATSFRPLSLFISQLAEVGSQESWCQGWLREMLGFTRPKSTTNSPHSWLLTFILIGRIDSPQAVENALDLLISSIIPALNEDDNLNWTDSMSRGLIKCSLKPFSVGTWRLASDLTRRKFVSGPIKKLISDAGYEEIAPLLQFLVDLLTRDIDVCTDVFMEFAGFIFAAPSSAYDQTREQIIDSVCKAVRECGRVSGAEYEALSSLIHLVLSNNRLDLAGASDLVAEYVKFSLDELWAASYSNEQPSRNDGEIVAYLKTLDVSEAQLFSQQLWLDVLAKIKSEGCPKDSAAVLSLLSKLSISSDVCREAWLSELVSLMADLAAEVEALSQDLPIFVRTEVFPIYLLPRIAPIIVVLQTGLKLDLHRMLTPHSAAHSQLTNALLTLHFWLSTGTLEPFILADISPNAFFVPTKNEEKPSLANLLSYLDGMCSEIVDAVYDFKDFDTSNGALRAALARRLVSVHPQEWPLAIKEAATCSPPERWLEEHVTTSLPDDFLQLCEVCLPVGVLRRCLPRSTIIGHVQGLSAKKNPNSGDLARLLELIASLSSVAFVGSSYAFSLSPIVLEDAVRGPLVESEDEETLSGELLRAKVASMKILQTFMLLRQPVRSLENAFPGLGLASLSIWLRKTKPRLTRDQWDSLLCLVASWVVQAVVRPVKPTAFPAHTFRLVAAIGALFVNSLCSSTTITSALIRKETAQATSVDELMDMNCEEWDETDFDFPDEYDCEDDGSVIPAEDVKLFDDDFVDVDDEELRFEDPNAQRRLPPPAFVQRDWQEYFVHEIFRSLICLSTELCLHEDGSKKSYALKDTPPHLTALCAAMATCPVDTFLSTLQQQSDIVVTYLFDNPQSCSDSRTHSPRIENNLFSTECILAPIMRNALDLTVRFIATSPYQSGQLLGHILLTRLVASRSLHPVRRMSDVLIPHLPITWVNALTARLTDELESIVEDADKAVSQWGRGMFGVEQLLGEDIVAGHQRLLSYLLAWDAVVSLLSSASQQSRAGLQAALLNDEFWIAQLCRLTLTLGLLLPKQAEIQGVLNTPCRLEPDLRLLLTSSARTALSKDVASTREIDSVFAPLDGLLHLPGHRLSGDLRHLAVRLLRRLLSESPALMRTMYAEMQRGAMAGEHITAGQARQLSSRLEKVVRSQFSTQLIVDEVGAVERRANEFKRCLGAAPYLDTDLPGAGSVDIKGRPLSREIITKYHFSSDQSLEMMITLPENFPLSPVNVETGSRIGIVMSNWRGYVFLLSVFINNQNGSILEGIGLWLRNLKKKFDGVEECPICYSVIHDRDFSFPRMQCRVCKKKFHSSCMYRYFQTSSSPTCPLCRSLFHTKRG
ncbi:hypothetical protein Aperf_G00000081614 [Anoplocephala perfoliata]